DLSVKVINQGNSSASGAFKLSLVHPWNKTMHSTHYSFVGPSTLIGNKLHNDKVPDLEKNGLDYADNVNWTAFSTKYFMTAVVPLDSARGKVQLRKQNNFVFNRMDAPLLSLAPGHEADYHYLVYFGPRDLDILKKVDHHLAKAIDFGFFSILAVPLLYVLKFFYAYVGNYGIAIIIVTVIIKLLFWPLTQKSYTSMKAMQTLQPQMQKIREKHKNDRERLNREIMQLYKKHRVNPLGGCLPMVVQIPVFFALYEMLLGSIELRHAYFALWLTDLSAKDPYYITPLIMGVTMFIQQKMSPTSMDPTQAKLFLLMPVVFTFLFLNFPSGLVLYWLVNNILTIVQQWFINKKADAQPA
ncbi:MAG TPA: membrane protein insertase YidC, partial [Desulfuromonadales bacterium]|nr:membrane protein insertase YidC [Desulfuromonadales bacterium]